MSDFYITTAIEYANGEPHLGHAFEKIGADAIARYRRLRGDTVHLLVGTDDHGLKVARAADAAGLTPIAQADRISATFRDTWDALGIAYDRFVRTTSATPRRRRPSRSSSGSSTRHPIGILRESLRRAGTASAAKHSARTRELDDGTLSHSPFARH